LRATPSVAATIRFLPFPVSNGGAIDCDGPYKARKLGKNAGDRTSAARVEESWREIAV
jgi:hypothetical protein